MERKLQDGHYDPEKATRDFEKLRGRPKRPRATDDCGQIDCIIGSIGKYQLMIFMFKILIGVTSAFNNLGVTFYAPSEFVSFWCADTEQYGSIQQSAMNQSTAITTTTALSYDPNHQPVNAGGYMRNESVILSNQHAAHPMASASIRQLLGDFVFNSERGHRRDSAAFNSDTPRNLRKECDYLSPVDGQRHKCTSYRYDTGIWMSTIIDEWNLVCDRSLLISITQSLYMGGFIISFLVFGYLSDRFGRWKSLLLGAIIEILSGFGCAFAGSVSQFMMFRFLLGLGNAGRSSSSYLIMIEWTGQAWRMHISTLGSIGWVVGYCLMPWIVMFFLHFRHMQLFVCFYEIIFLVWLLALPESPRWLLTHRRFDEAYEVLLHAAKFNGLIKSSGSSNKSSSESIANQKAVNLLSSSSSSSSSSSIVIKKKILALEGDANCPVLSVNGSLPRKRLNSISTGDGTTALNGQLNGHNLTTCAPIQETDHQSDGKPTGGTGTSTITTALQPYTVEEFNVKFAKLAETISQKEFTKNEHKLSIVDLFKWSNLRSYTLILAFAWACNSFIYYGIALRVGDFGGKNLFVSFSFAGATELPSIAFTMLCMKFLPRRTTNIFLFSTIFLLSALQKPLKYYELGSLQQTTMILAKLFNSCSFTCILYQTMELFPTSIRQTAYSSCSLAGRIGSILAPFIKELSQMTNALVPPVIYAVLSLMEIGLIRHLPETQGSDLPDTLLEAEKFKGTDKEEMANGSGGGDGSNNSSCETSESANGAKLPV